MKMPNYRNASVEKSKITDYLLSTTHSKGRIKARLFIKFGFSSDKYELLIDALKKHAYNEYKEKDDSKYGVSYVIEANLETPNKRTLLIRSVWLIEPGELAPRFVTAYPA